MRNWLPCSCVTLALSLPSVGAAAQQAAPAPPVLVGTQPHADPNPQLSALLEKQVRAAWEAFGKKDRDAYARFLTDDFQAVESDGDGERPRLRVLREVEHCMFSSYLLQFFQVQPLGSDYAFVTYESTMQFPRTAALRFRRVFIGELWIRRNAQWKMMRYQETVVR
jgi:uncharacterized protein DUF4440